MAVFDPPFPNLRRAGSATGRIETAFDSESYRSGFDELGWGSEFASGSGLLFVEGLP